MPTDASKRKTRNKIDKQIKNNSTLKSLSFREGFLTFIINPINFTCQANLRWYDDNILEADNNHRQIENFKKL